MVRSYTYFKLNRDGSQAAPVPSEMDWRVLYTRLIRKSHDLPYGWIRVGANNPKRIPAHIVARGLGVKKDRVQVYYHLSRDHKLGDLPPDEIVVNEFKGNRGVLKIDRQKKHSGEIPLWDTWVRLTPPETLDVAHQRRQDTYDKERRKSLEGERQMLDRRPLTEDEIRQDYIDNMRWPGARVRAQKEWEMEKVQNAIDLKHARIANHRIGSVGLKEWQVAQALESIEERRRQSAEAVERMIAARAAKREEQK